MKTSRLLLASLIVNVAVIGSAITYLVLNRGPQSSSNQAETQADSQRRAPASIRSAAGESHSSLQMRSAGDIPSSTASSPSALPAVSLKPGKTFSDSTSSVTQNSSSPKANSGAGISSSTTPGDVAPNRERSFSAPTYANATSALNSGSGTAGGSAPINGSGASTGGSIAAPEIISQPGSLTDDINPQAEGNNFAADGKRVALEEVEYLSDEEVALNFSVTPENEPSEKTAAGKLHAGLTYEQELFRTRWGWQAFSEAQTSARDDLNP